MAVTNGYADGNDAQALLNQLGGAIGALTLGAGSTPTLAQVETWLDGITADVDAILRAKGYGTVPATGTNDVLLIGRYVAMEAAYMAYGAGFHFNDEPAKVTAWHTEYTAFRDRLLDDHYRLIDQAPTVGDVAGPGVVQAFIYTGD